MSHPAHIQLPHDPVDIRAEIARALKLSASLNDPADHQIVAQYIAELESAAGTLTTNVTA